MEKYDDLTWLIYELFQNYALYDPCITYLSWEQRRLLSQMIISYYDSMFLLKITTNSYYYFDY